MSNIELMLYAIQDTQKRADQALSDSDYKLHDKLSQDLKALKRWLVAEGKKV